MFKGAAFFLMTFIAFSSGSSYAMEAVKAKVLNPLDRPEEVKLLQDKVFENIAFRVESSWTYNGESLYHMGAIDERLLITYLVKSAPQQKEFYLLDIGAGNFQWGKSMAEYINQAETISLDKTFHIISVRGERNLATERRYKGTQTGKCILYELGEIKIEDLEQELERHGLAVKDKLDVIVSRWSLRHLIDPLGTFKQAYDLVRPQKGFLLMDGFFFVYDDFIYDEKEMNEERLVNYDDGYDKLVGHFNKKLHTLLVQAGVKCLRFYYSLGRSTDHFIIQRKSNEPLSLPVQYTGKVLKVNNKGWQAGCGYVTEFVSTGLASKKMSYERVRDIGYKDLIVYPCWGDETLYNLCLAEGLFILPQENLVWRKIIEEQ